MLSPTIVTFDYKRALPADGQPIFRPIFKIFLDSQNLGDIYLYLFYFIYYIIYKKDQNITDWIFSKAPEKLKT